MSETNRIGVSISVNGVLHELTEQRELGQALPLWGFSDPSAVVVAVNQQFVPREDWGDTALHDGDRVDVLQAVVGG
jgi:thiamine biosynthesis protein ThiS